MFRYLTVKNDKVHGKFLGAEVGIEEMHRKDESRGQQGLVGMDDGRHVEHPAGQEAAEKLREPEHQAGAADGEHAPEERWVSAP